MAKVAWLSVTVWAGAWLLTAGLRKLVVPQSLSTALDELLGSAADRSLIVRCFAVGEVIVAVSLVTPFTAIAFYGCVALGVLFVGFGTAGRVRNLQEPCGCYGPRGKTPLGLPAVGAGFLFLLVGIGRQLAAPLQSDEPLDLMLTLLGVVALAIAAFQDRDLIRDTLSIDIWTTSP